MTKIIGLTGGIGSGKTTVAKYIESFGIPVYISDLAAKEILHRSENTEIVRKAFGNAVFVDGNLDRKKLAEVVFNNPDKLKLLNTIIHPLVKNDFEKWLSLHINAPFIIREAAILFESGSYKDCDAIITVTAPAETRIERVMARDQITKKQVLERIKNQWSDMDRIAKSDFVIINDTIATMQLQVSKILKKLQNI